MTHTKPTSNEPGKYRLRTPVNAIQSGRRYAWDSKREHDWHPDIMEPDFWEMVEEFWDYTVLGTAALYNLYSSCRYIFDRRIPGDIVECGVFLGGSIMFFVELCKRYGATNRVVYGLDTFTGFLRRSEKDIDYDGQPLASPSQTPRNFRQEAEANIRSVEWNRDRVRVIEGDVAVTVPALSTQTIAILRLDTDTYDTTLVELEGLYPKVSEGGVVIIDDYGWGLGARAAVDEYFADQPICLMRVDRYCRAFVKTSTPSR